jgi:acyl dehydratase
MSAFDRIPLNERRELGAHHFTADEIKRFAAAYDPQPFHLDEEAGARSLFGGLCASGWHTAAVMMRVFVDSLARDAEQAKRRGEPALRYGVSPGFDDLKWLRPVYPGDTITFASEVVAKRRSKSRPGWGILTLATQGRNQTGAPVFSLTSHLFVATTEDEPEPLGGRD